RPAQCRSSCALDTLDGGMALDSEAVEIRAFRGSRRTSVYREHVLSERAFAQILAAGERKELALLSSLDQYGPHELDKRKAAQLADEATSIRTSGELLDLDDDLTAIAGVAPRCGPASAHPSRKTRGP